MQTLNPQLQKAVQLHQNGQFKEAETEYKALLIAPGADPSIYSYLADALNRQGKYEESVKLLNTASQNHSNIPNLKITLAQTLLQTGDTIKAKQLVQSLALQYPQMGEVHYMLGNIYMQENKLDEALASFEKTMQYLPLLPEPRYNMGLIYYQKGEFARAEKLWKECLKLQAAFVPALLNLGNMELERNHHKGAIQYLEKVLKIDPNHPFAHRLIGMAKHFINETDSALDHYKRLLEIQGPGEEVFVLLGNASRDLNRLAEAEEYYEKTLKLNPENTIAKDNLSKLRGKRIEGWHFDMLGDLARNEGYDQVIKRHIKGGETVLDIGTGSGLLSMMCARAGATTVYTCETIKDIAEAAEEVIADNGYADTINVFQAKSNSLKIGEEIPEKVDILVSEVLDAGLLGEGVLPTVRHAASNFLKKNGTIIPQAATLKGMLIQSEHLRSIAPLAQLSGFDLSSFGKFQVRNTYRREILNNTPHQNLTDVFDILNIDFYNLPRAASPDDPNESKLRVEVTGDGMLHGIAFWFDLHLDKELTLSSGPEGEMIHWGQAVYCFPEARAVKKGEVIEVEVEQSEQKITFSLVS